MIDLSELRLDIVGIVGSRGPDPDRKRLTGWTNARLIEKVVQRLVELNPHVTVISGGAPSGVDQHARLACLTQHFCFGQHLIKDPTTVDCPMPHFHELKAQWREAGGRLNRHAGFDRNDKLVRHCTLVLALFGPGERTPGTSDVIRRCGQYNVPVLVYHKGVWRHE